MTSQNAQNTMLIQNTMLAQNTKLPAIAQRTKYHVGKNTMLHAIPKRTQRLTGTQNRDSLALAHRDSLTLAQRLTSLTYSLQHCDTATLHLTSNYTPSCNAMCSCRQLSLIETHWH